MTWTYKQKLKEPVTRFSKWIAANGKNKKNLRDRAEQK